MTATGEVHTDHVTGLTGAQVAARVARGQVNELGERTSRSIGEIVRANVFTRFNAILGALFVLVMTTGSWADGLFGIVLVVNSSIGIVQEYLAKRKLDRLALLNAPTTRVVRDGEVTVVPTREVVLDDLIELRTGDEVPADGLLLTSEGLELNESNLTGESDPVHHPVGDEIRSGTSVVAGSGRYHAHAVGADAYVNRIAAEARKFTRTRSEIQSSINTLLRYITWIIAVALPLQIWSQWRTVGDQGWESVVIRSAAGVVGLVPEGLVLLTSVAFLLAAVQLTRDQVLVQQLPAVEGLARVDVVCLDKTGTLTVGEIAFEDAVPVGGADRDEIRCALGALADDRNANGTLAAVGAALEHARLAAHRDGAVQLRAQVECGLLRGARDVGARRARGAPGRGRPAARRGRGPGPEGAARRPAGAQRRAPGRPGPARGPRPGGPRHAHRADPTGRASDPRVLRRAGRRHQDHLRRQPADRWRRRRARSASPGRSPSTPGPCPTTRTSWPRSSSARPSSGGCPRSRSGPSSMHCRRMVTSSP